MTDARKQPVAVIHNRRFYWRYPDGAMRPVVLSKRAKGPLLFWTVIALIVAPSYILIKRAIDRDKDKP